MAPRESTGLFHDQFLQFDYETTLQGGPPPLDAAPAAGLPADLDSLDGAGAAAEPEALGAVETGTESATDTHHRSSAAAAAAAPVDPLSIDPTDDQSAAWSLVASARAGEDLPPRYLSAGLLPAAGVVPTTTGPAAAATPGGRTVASVTSVGSDPRPIDHHTAVLSPLSVGSAAGPAGAAPGSPTSPNAARTGQAAAPATAAARRPRPATLVSMLDASMSIEESDHTAGGPVPLLERTFDSGTSAGASAASVLSPWPAAVAAPAGNDDMEEDDEDEDDASQASEEEDGDDPSQLSSASSVSTSDTLRMIYRNSAFEGSTAASPLPSSPSSSDDTDSPPPASPPGAALQLSFGPGTTVVDLKYFAERGCIVPLLQALDTPRLVTLGARMLADYAKLAHRRAAVASNRRILEFLQRTMRLPVAEDPDWPGREYAVETVRSLTATEESDRFLMGAPGLLRTLALVARGGPFAAGAFGSQVPLASDKARLHACIAVMNLSCGKANKIEIAKCPEVLESMRDVMLGTSEEARLKATTCIKNLSNADANDAALLAVPGLVEALAHVAAATCASEAGATACTTNACLALMNLSIAKANKHRVYRTPGTMDALMAVLRRTRGQESAGEARVKACSALSNLAIGYDNKIPMFNYPGFVETILDVINTDVGEAKTKACSILWSFAAEMRNQVPVVRRGDILPVLVRVAAEDGASEARFKCVAALTLLAESLENVIPLLEAGALHPLMDILHDAGPDPTQWKGQTASWCVGFLMNIAQSDEAVPALREAGVVELLAPLLTLDHYQSLKAAMAVTFCCRYDEGDECYDLLRKTENVIPKIVSLLHNTLAGRGGNGYKYGVFTLRSSVGCISALASGPEFMKERIATAPVFESLLRVISDFCVDGGTPGAIVGGGRDDTLSATLAMRALHSLTVHLIPIVGSSGLPFGPSMEERLLIALESFEACSNPGITDATRSLASDAKVRIDGGRHAARIVSTCHIVRDNDGDMDAGDIAFLTSNCCGFDAIPCMGEDFLRALSLPTLRPEALPSAAAIVRSSSVVEDETSDETSPVRTFLLTDASTGRCFVVPCEQSGGRSFNDVRMWCYRRGRFCAPGEVPDENYIWTAELQAAYEAALANQMSL